MRKLITVILASTFLTAISAVAADNEALPKALTDLGITSEDLSDVDSAVVDLPTGAEANIFRRHGRYCPRGYRLEAYRIRIGRFVVVRYRCVRTGHHHHHHQIMEEPNQQQDIQE